VVPCTTFGQHFVGPFSIMEFHFRPGTYPKAPQSFVHTVTAPPPRRGPTGPLMTLSATSGPYSCLAIFHLVRSFTEIVPEKFCCASSRPFSFVPRYTLDFFSTNPGLCRAIAHNIFPCGEKRFLCPPPSLFWCV